MKKSKNGKKIVTVMVMILMTMLVFAPSKYASAKTRYYVGWRYYSSSTLNDENPIVKVKLKKNKLTFYGKVYYSDEIGRKLGKTSKGSKITFTLSTKCKYYESEDILKRISSRKGRKLLKNMSIIEVRIKEQDGKVVRIVFSA